MRCQCGLCTYGWSGHEKLGWHSRDTAQSLQVGDFCPSCGSRLGREGVSHDGYGELLAWRGISSLQQRALHGDSSAGELALQRFKEILPLKGEYL